MSIRLVIRQNSIFWTIRQILIKYQIYQKKYHFDVLLNKMVDIKTY